MLTLIKIIVHDPVLTQLWLWGLMLAHILLFLLVAIHCLRSRREPTSTILWIFLAWALPFLGALLYAALGVNRVADKGFLKHSSDQKLLQERQSRENSNLPLAYWRAVHEGAMTEPEDDFSQHLNHALNGILPDHPLLGGNHITPLFTGDETYPALFKAIGKATHHVHLQSFIIGNDHTGKKLLELLKQKASEGVRVRLMYDRFGSTHAFLGGFFRKYEHIPNMQIVGWTQANPFKRQFQINLRNHRKIAVIDGQYAFCGGVNLHDENTTRGTEEAIRDYHFSIQGPMVQELQFTFMRDWFFMTNESTNELFAEAYFPQLEPTGTCQARLVNHGPSSSMETLADVIFMALINARRQILAVTPYFVPPHDILHALRAAALRGVDVKIIVPRKNNHVYAGLAGCGLYEDLLLAGVKVFERDPPFMHAKALLVDDGFALVGTANLDMRSLRLNYETNLAIFDKQFVNTFKPYLLDDLAHSHPVNLLEWRKRPTYRRVLENFAYLLSPIL